MKALTAMVLAALLFTGCGGNKKKGSTAKSAGDAKAMSQKTGSEATGHKSEAMSSGATSGGVTCDAGLEGVGFCATDAQIVFCSGGTWWVLDCAALDAFCGEDEANGTIDCYQ